LRGACAEGENIECGRRGIADRAEPGRIARRGQAGVAGADPAVGRDPLPGRRRPRGVAPAFPDEAVRGTADRGAECAGPTPDRVPPGGTISRATAASPSTPGLRGTRSRRARGDPARLGGRPDRDAAAPAMCAEPASCGA